MNTYMADVKLNTWSYKYELNIQCENQITVYAFINKDSERHYASYRNNDKTKVQYIGIYDYILVIINIKGID